jgi:hypothetical protein
MTEQRKYNTRRVSLNDERTRIRKILLFVVGSKLNRFYRTITCPQQARDFDTVADEILANICLVTEPKEY